MVNLNKKGIIILSHYRSGGTLLRQFLEWLTTHHFKMNTDEIGEIDMIEGSYNDDTRVDYKKLIKENFESFDKGFKIIQLNNPLLITYLYSRKYFNFLAENYEIIHLERKDLKKSILSLPLWEHKLKYSRLHSDKSDEEIIKDFHDFCLRRPIHYENIYSGIHFDHPNSLNYRNYLDFQLMLFFNTVHINEFVSKQFMLERVYYEDFENKPNKNFLSLFSNLISEDEAKNHLQRLKKMKIQYFSSDYLQYFDNKVKEVFEYWGL